MTFRSAPYFSTPTRTFTQRIYGDKHALIDATVGIIHIVANYQAVFGQPAERRGGASPPGSVICVNYRSQVSHPGFCSRAPGKHSGEEDDRLDCGSYTLCLTLHVLVGALLLFKPDKQQTLQTLFDIFSCANQIMICALCYLLPQVRQPGVRQELSRRPPLFAH